MKQIKSSLKLSETQKVLGFGFCYGLFIVAFLFILGNMIHCGFSTIFTAGFDGMTPSTILFLGIIIAFFSLLGSYLWLRVKRQKGEVSYWISFQKGALVGIVAVVFILYMPFLIAFLTQKVSADYGEAIGWTIALSIFYLPASILAGGIFGLFANWLLRKKDFVKGIGILISLFVFASVISWSHFSTRYTTQRFSNKKLQKLKTQRESQKLNKQDEVEELIKHLAHETYRDRQVAAKTLLNMDPNVVIPAVENALREKLEYKGEYHSLTDRIASKNIIGECFQILKEMDDPRTIEALKQVYYFTKDRHLKYMILHAFRDKPKQKELIPFLIEVLGTGDNMLCEPAIWNLERITNYRFRYALELKNPTQEESEKKITWQVEQWRKWWVSNKDKL